MSDSRGKGRYTVIDRDEQRCREDIPAEDLGAVLAMLKSVGHRYKLIDQERDTSEVVDGDGE